MMPAAYVGLEVSQTASLPLLLSLISRCFRAVIAAVFALLSGPKTRLKALSLLMFPHPFGGGTAKSHAHGAASRILFDPTGRAHYDGPMPFAADTAPPLPARAQALFDFW